MTDGSRLREQLQRLRRRALADRGLWAGLRAVIAAGAWTAGVLAVARVAPFAWAPAVTAAGAVAAAVGAAALWWTTRPSPALVARAADARLGLRERLASGLAVEGTDTELADRLRDDAAHHAETARSAAVYPLRRHRRSGLMAAGVSAVAMTLLLLPDPRAAQRAQRRLDAAAVTRARQAVEAQRRTVAAERRAPDPGGRRAALERELQDALRALAAVESPRQALERLSQLSGDLAPLSDPGLADRDAAASAAGQALGSAPGGAALGEALMGHRDAAAAAELGSLAGRTPSLSEQDRRDLGRALAGGAAAGAGDTPLSEALGAAADALAAGDASGAQRALDAGASELSALDAAKNVEQQLAVTRAAIDRARQDAARRADADERAAAGQQAAGGTGQGQGGAAGHGQDGAAGQGQGSQGQGGAAGQGQGAGQGSQGQGGQGHGGSGGSGRGPGPAAGTEQLFVAGQPGAGVDQPGPHPLGPGQSVPHRDVAEVFATFQDDALDAVDRGTVSGDDRDLVRLYFSSLGAGRP